MRLLGFVTLAGILALTVACGGDEEDGGAEGGNGSPTTAATGDRGGDSEARFDVVIAVPPECVFQCFFFDPKTFTVSAGATVTLNITNETDTTHNMRVAGEDGRYDTADDTVSDAAIPGGGTATLDLTAPAEPGSFRFRCDFHPTYSGMTGGITVE